MLLWFHPMTYGGYGKYICCRQNSIRKTASMSQVQPWLHKEMYWLLSFDRKDSMIKWKLNYCFPGVEHQHHNLHLLSEGQLVGATNKTNEIWSIEYPKEPYDVNLDEINLEVVYKSRCKYDLRAAARRHRHFFYHVSLPHYRSGPFLHESIERFYFIHTFIAEFYNGRFRGSEDLGREPPHPLFHFF